MKIRIIDYNPESSKVSFSSEYGIASGIWKGEQIEDKEYKEYYVEINIPVKVSCLNIRIVNEAIPRILTENNSTKIFGCLKDIEIGYATLIVGKSLIMLELEQGRFEMFENKYVQLDVPYIELYDEGIN